MKRVPSRASARIYASGSPISLLRLALPGVVFFLLVQALLTATVWFDGFGEFSGPDPYMRLVRILECRGGVDCPDGLLLRSNVPYGEVLHWPFFLDRLILLLAGPFLLLMDIRAAVTAAGYLIGPVLGVAAIFALTSVARSILADRAARWVPLLASTHYWAVYAFSPVRPDHHGLQVLLFLIALMGVFRILLGAEGERGGWVAGIAVGLAIWVSTEGLASAGFLLGVLAVAWIVKGGRELTGVLSRVWCVGAAVLGLGLLVDGPEPWRWAVEFDRFSVVHMTALTLGAAWWSLLLLKVPKSVPARILVALSGAAAAGALLIHLFPGVEQGPLADLHPDLVPLWLDYVVEFAPAWHFGGGTWGVMAVGPGIVGLVVAGFAAKGVRREGWRGVFPTSQKADLGWLVVAITLVWFLVLSILGQVRWTHYVHVLAPLGIAALLGRFLEGVKGMATAPLVRAVASVGVVLLFFALPPAYLAFPGEGNEATESKRSCSPGPVVPALADLDNPGGRRMRVLAPVFWGPELLFRAGVDVVAGPYHRNALGMLDSHGIMAATEPGEAGRILRDRDIDLVVLCVTEDWIPFVPADSAGTLYNSLVAGRPPPWLRRIPLMGAPEQYRLYQVIEDLSRSNRGPPEELLVDS